MDVIEKDQQQVNTVRAVVQKEKQITDIQTKRVQAAALKAQRDLDHAIPQLQAANAALNTLSKCMIHLCLEVTMIEMTIRIVELIFMLLFS